MNNNVHILSVGGTGLVGSRVFELLSGVYTFEDASRSSGLDITDEASVIRKLRESRSSVVILYAAKSDVEGCEKDKPLGENGEAWNINVLGAENVARGCRETGKKLVYISTDFVFGKNEPDKKGFNEEDTPRPVNWYGQTKYEAEKRIKKIAPAYVIVRIAYPYRANFIAKKDFVRVFLTLLQQGKKISLITDHLNNPTFIDDIAYGLDALIKNHATGIYHVTGGEVLSPYDAGIKIAEIFDLDKTLIGKTTRAEFFKDRAPRPFSLAMNNDKIHLLGVSMKTFTQGLSEVKRQISSSVSL